MPAGRPTKLNKKIFDKAREYIDSCVDVEDEFHSTRGEKTDGYQRILRVNIPTIEGLALYLHVDRTSIYEWKEKNKEFSYILKEIMDKQHQALLKNGLSGDYNPLITKLMLTKHGYSDKTETDITSQGKAIKIAGFQYIVPNGDNTDNQTQP